MDTRERNAEQQTPSKPGDAVNHFFDERAQKAKAIAIYLAETKIWERMLENCGDYTGFMKPDKCQSLADIVAERVYYYNSNFNPACRPKLSPGLPEKYEFRGYPTDYN